MRKVIIDQAVFEQFPDFKRGLVIVSDIDNAPQNQNIQALLNDAIERNIGKNAVEHDFVRAWDTAHSRFGSKQVSSINQIAVEKDRQRRSSAFH